MIDLNLLNADELFDENNLSYYIRFKNGTEISKEFLNDIITILGEENVKEALNKINETECKCILNLIKCSDVYSLEYIALY